MILQFQLLSDITVISLYTHDTLDSSTFLNLIVLTTPHKEHKLYRAPHYAVSRLICKIAKSDY